MKMQITQSKLGYGGTKKEMERLLVDAEKLTGVKYDMENLGDVYAAIHAIQENLGLTGVAAAEAEGTFTGSMAAMQAATKNFLADLALGNDVSEDLEIIGVSVFTFVEKNLIPMLGNIVKALPDAFSSVLSFFIGALNKITHTDFAQLVDVGVNFVNQIITGMIETIPYLMEDAVKIAMSLGQALIEYDWLGTVSAFIAEIKRGLEQAGGEILGSDDNIVTAVLDGIYNNLPSVLDAGINLVTNLLDGIIGKLPQVASVASNVLATMISTIGKYLPTVLKTGIELLGKLVAGIIQAIPKLIDAIPKIIKAIKDGLGKVNWAELGINIIKGIAEGLKNAAGLIADAAKDAAKKALESAKSFLGIHSPSRVFRDEVGKQLSAGMAIGITDNVGYIEDAMRDASDVATNNLSAGFNATLASNGELASGAGASNNVTINVYGAVGQDVSELARQIETIITRNTRRAQAAWA